jgi:hypothetical protein
MFDQTEGNIKAILVSVDAPNSPQQTKLRWSTLIYDQVELIASIYQQNTSWFPKLEDKMKTNIRPYLCF